jgi:hypothetical protein
MAVELSTIPLYLYGMYSVNNAPAVSGAVRGASSCYLDFIALTCFVGSGVVIEEMLHLCLAGNALLAVGGTPKLYDPNIIPKYPAPMLGRKPELILQLREMTKENLQTYIDVRLYYIWVLAVGADNIITSARIARGSRTPHTEPDEYNTLGQFYKAIEQGELIIFRIFSSGSHQSDRFYVPV